MKGQFPNDPDPGSSPKRAFEGLLAGKSLTASQIEFINLMIDYLT
jgi:hypothetical protein